MPAQWRESVVEYIRLQAKPIDKFGHQPRLYALAKTIANGLDYDDDVLFAAAWLHDLGVFVGHRPEDPVELAHWNHVPYTLARVRELLPPWGFPPEKLPSVAEVIQTHQPKDSPGGIEAVILRDADILEQLGAVGAMRALVKVGRDTRYPTFSSVMSVMKSAVELLPGMLRLSSSKHLVADRVEALRSFIAAVEAESGNLLY